MSGHLIEPPYNPHRFPHFDPPDQNQRLSDVMYAVSGRTRAENHLITIAREEFVLSWLSDTRMLSRLNEWRASVDHPAIVIDIADFLDRVAERYGFSRRADLGRIPAPPQTSIEDFIPEWYRLQDRLYTAYRRGRTAMDAIEIYVRDELRQPWPWLVGRLAHHVFQQAWEQAVGVTMVHQRASYLDDHLWGPWVTAIPFRL